MNGFESNASLAETRQSQDRTGNFRSNVIETLRWYCSEKRPEEIASALEMLFSSAPRCKLMRCEVIFLGDEGFSDDMFEDETGLQRFSATTIPFYSETSGDLVSLIQVCVNGTSLEGGAWQVRLQLAVNAGSDCVWKSVLNDISALHQDRPEPTLIRPEQDCNQSVTCGESMNDELELDYTAVTRELVHELRNPLGAIITSTELVLTKNDQILDSEDRKLLEIVANQAETADSRLREFVKLMAPFVTKRSRLDLLHLLEKAAERSPFVSAIPDMAHGALPALQKGSAIVEADASLWEQVFAFMLEQLPGSVAGCGPVQIRTMVDSSILTIKFEYSGDGIRPDLLRKVLLPFASTKDGGSGLDGPPVYRIVSAHGGNMSAGSIESATVMTMRIPLCRK